MGRWNRTYNLEVEALERAVDACLLDMQIFGALLLRLPCEQLLDSVVPTHVRVLRPPSARTTASALVPVPAVVTLDASIECK
jgi:hypothetical protein